MSPVSPFLPTYLTSAAAPSHFWCLGCFSLWVQFHVPPGVTEHHALHLSLHRASVQLTLPTGCPKGNTTPVHAEHAECVLQQSSPCIPALPSSLCPHPQGHLRPASSPLNLHLLSSPRAIRSTTQVSPCPPPPTTSAALISPLSYLDHLSSILTCPPLTGSLLQLCPT